MYGKKHSWVVQGVMTLECLFLGVSIACVCYSEVPSCVKVLEVMVAGFIYTLSDAPLLLLSGGTSFCWD